jgi:hypothetical protein
MYRYEYCVLKHDCEHSVLQNKLNRAIKTRFYSYSISCVGNFSENNLPEFHEIFLKT